MIRGTGRSGLAGAVVALAALIAPGCEQGTNTLQDLEIRIFLTDIQGNPRLAVRTGEEFRLALSVRNLTENVQPFTYSPPEFVFTILLGNSIVMSSTEGYAYPPVIVADSLAPDSARTGDWIAPASPERPEFVLPPGRYTAEGRWTVPWMSRGSSVLSRVHFLVTD